jgi:hypothetical protein
MELRHLESRVVAVPFGAPTTERSVMTTTAPRVNMSSTEPERAYKDGLTTLLIFVSVVVGVFIGHFFWKSYMNNVHDNNLIASFRTSSGVQQTFQAAACDIVTQPGSVVIRTPRGFIYDDTKAGYTRYDIYVFTAVNNGDGTYGLVSERLRNPSDPLVTLDDASDC